MTFIFKFLFSFIGKIGVESSTFWALGLSIAFKLIIAYLDKKKADDKLKQNFIDFVTAMHSGGLINIELRNEAQSQFEQLNKKDTPST